MQDKEKINFDLDFLDNNTKEKPKQSPKLKGGNSMLKDDPKPDTEAKGSNWGWIIGIGVVVILVIIGLASDDSSNPSTSSDHNFTTSDGNTYRCSDSKYNYALALKPTDAESNILDNRISANKAERSRLDSMYVDEYDQYSIDNYNEAVDAFNYSNNKLKVDAKAFDDKVEYYNDYLDANCTQQ